MKVSFSLSGNSVARNNSARLHFLSMPNFVNNGHDQSKLVTSDNEDSKEDSLDNN